MASWHQRIVLLSVLEEGENIAFRNFEWVIFLDFFEKVSNKVSKPQELH